MRRRGCASAVNERLSRSTMTAWDWFWIGRLDITTYAGGAWRNRREIQGYPA